MPRVYLEINNKGGMKKSQIIEQLAMRVHTNANEKHEMDMGLNVITLS